MGTEIPLVEYDKEASEGTPNYAFYSTRVSLDEAQKAFNRVKELTIKLSTIETSAIRLATNIKKTAEACKCSLKIHDSDLRSNCKEHYKCA